MHHVSTSNHMFKSKIWDNLGNLKSPEWNEGDFKIPKNGRGKFSPNFTNKHVIRG